MRKRLLLFMVGGMIVAITLGTAIFRHVRSQQPLPFDPVAWQLDSHGDSGKRWQMQDDALRRLRSGEIATRDEADRLLGPGFSSKTRFRRYRLGEGSLPIDSLLLDVVFDQDGRVMPKECAIRPGHG